MRPPQDGTAFDAPDTAPVGVECRTGTLEEYLPGVEKYLEEKRHKVSVREKLKEKKAAVQANDEKANNASKKKSENVR